MSDLESQCKESLLKVFVHDPALLSAEDLSNIARWAMKTAIVAAYCNPGSERRLQPDIAKAFYENDRMLPHCIVFLGTYRGGLEGLRFSKEIPRYLDIENPGWNDVAIYDWTASILAAVLKVIVLPSRTWPYSFEIEFPERRPLAPVWPARLSSLAWPVYPAHRESDVVLSSYAILSGRIEIGRG
jgi:hypothetical protein